MMATVFDLIRNIGNVIMLRASPTDIAREREELSKWFSKRWSEIPKQHALAKAIISAEDEATALRKRFGRRAGSILAKHASAAGRDMVEKAELGDQLAAAQIVAKLRTEPGLCGSAPLAGLAEMAKVLTEHNERKAELDRLEKRSDAYRFAIDPTPPPPRGGLH